VKTYIIAGEASGDLHASNLVKALLAQNTKHEIRGWGGDMMSAAGVNVVKHYRELAFMGFTEVIMNLRTILNNLERCKADIAAWKPDLVILVDYPGFNLRIAPFAKKIGIPVVYYISPQLWAWKEGRVKIIRESVDKMLCILPFEKSWYKERGVEAAYVGHPLLDALEEYPFRPDFRASNKLDERPILALLPGSRKQEIKIKLPIMLEATKEWQTDYQLVIAAAPGQSSSYYEPFLKNYGARMVQGQTYDLLKNAQFAIVTSGTATLETALIGTPELVVYKGNPISYQIGKRLVKVKYISLVNLILDQPLLAELIQNDCNPEQVHAELLELKQPKRLTEIRAGYEKLKSILGNAGASARAANEIETFMRMHLSKSK
jgi:lipid-A-disaccharide synthase